MSTEFISEGFRKGLERRMSRIAFLVFLVISIAVFFLFAVNQKYMDILDYTGTNVEDYIRFTAVVYTIVFGITILFETGELRRLSVFNVCMAALMTGLIILAKISLLDYQSDDYQIFLINWIGEYSEMTLREGLGTYIGSDYSPPYLYLLLLISRIPSFPWQYLIKAISIGFDALLGYGIMKLIGLQYESPVVRLGSFFLAMGLPTVVFNGAYWAQCDVLYSSLCILAIYLAMQKKDAVSFLLFGIALSFKLQSVFFFPILLPLWLRKDIRLRWIFLIPAGYMMMMLPALWGGKSMHHVLTVFIQQAGNYNVLSMNGTNFYELLMDSKVSGEAIYKIFYPISFYIAFGFMLTVCVYLCWNRDKITDDVLILAGLVFLSGIPYFLPKMHERYTFGADVLALAAAFRKPRPRILLPVCFGLASYICYTGGLPGDAVLHGRWAAVLMGMGLVLAIVELVSSVQKASLSSVKG